MHSDDVNQLNDWFEKDDLEFISENRFNASKCESFKSKQLTFANLFKYVYLKADEEQNSVLNGSDINLSIITASTIPKSQPTDHSPTLLNDEKINESKFEIIVIFF